MPTFYPLQSGLIYGQPLSIGDEVEFHTLVEFDVEWHGTESVAQGLFRVAESLERVQIPLNSAKWIAVEDTKETFQLRMDPERTHEWQENRADWKERKSQQEMSTEPLHMTDTLREVAPHAWEVRGQQLVYNTDKLPKNKKGENYGVINHFGNEDIHPGHQGTVNFLKARGENPAASKYSRLPPRRFIGLSEEAEASIIAAFEEWIDLGMQEFRGGGGGRLEQFVGGEPRSFYESNKGFSVSKHGVVQQRMAGGRFGPSIGRFK